MSTSHASQNMVFKYNCSKMSFFYISQDMVLKHNVTFNFSQNMALKYTVNL